MTDHNPGRLTGEGMLGANPRIVTHKNSCDLHESATKYPNKNLF